MDENNRKMIENFGDMVSATDKMAAPWRETVWKLVKALIITNLFWAIIVGMLIWFAYMTPIDSTQEQDFESGSQHQSYSQGVTNGG